MRHFEIRVTAFAEVLVLEAGSSGAALDHVASKLNFGDLKFSEARVIGEVIVMTPDTLDESSSHADITLNMQEI